MDTLNKHNKIALMYSGGKDSLACLYMLQEWWDKITVIWVNTGASFPEMTAHMEKVKSLVPHFFEMKSNQPSFIEFVGYPTDVVPVDYTSFGQALSGKKDIMLSSYIDCCAANIWRPGMDAVHAMGATLVVRGQKLADAKRSPVKSGDVIDGIEYFFPIEAWTDEQVMTYLMDKELAQDIRFKLKASSLDCWNCTAFSGEHHDKLEYMKQNHPELHKQYMRKLHEISAVVHSEMQHLEELVS